MIDYYKILGIEKDADLDKIKRAYRYSCKRYHPDLTSNENRGEFLKIQEAYDTLSDKQKRKVYDKSLDDGRQDIPQRSAGRGYQHYTPFKTHTSREFFSLWDEFFNDALKDVFSDPFWGNAERFFGDSFFGNSFFKSDDLNLELVLSRDEAKHGIDIPIEIPVTENCRDCGGRGLTGFFTCSTCAGSGSVNSSRKLTLRIPKGARTGSATRIPLESIGLRNQYLHVEIIVRS